MAVESGAARARCITLWMTLWAIAAGPPGTTTPIETMYLSASSTLMRSSMQSLRLSITK